VTKNRQDKTRQFKSNQIKTRQCKAIKRKTKLYTSKMTNQREMQVMHQHEKEGWKPVRCGAPDWLFIKIEKGEIIDCKFVEVKSTIDKLTTEQHLWRKVLKDFLSAKYEVTICD